MKEVRAQLLAQRRALSGDQIRELSRKITERFLKGCGFSPSDWQGKLVAVYRSLPSELDLRALEIKLEEWGAVLCFPRILDRQAGRMEFATTAVGISEWSKGAHGIEEPPLHFQTVPPERLDILFVPGVAFGLQGERIGMGGGYYDRYLPGTPQALKIALAFDFQLLPKLDQGSWDQPVDWIWTESRQIQLRTWSAPVRN